MLKQIWMSFCKLIQYNIYEREIREMYKPIVGHLSLQKKGHE